MSRLSEEFNNCGLFYLCYITKHLMTAPFGSICFGPLQSSEKRRVGVGEIAVRVG